MENTKKITIFIYNVKTAEITTQEVDRIIYGKHNLPLFAVLDYTTSAVEGISEECTHKNHNKFRDFGMTFEEAKEKLIRYYIKERNALLRKKEKIINLNIKAYKLQK